MQSSPIKSPVSYTDAIAALDADAGIVLDFEETTGNFLNGGSFAGFDLAPTSITRVNNRKGRPAAVRFSGAGSYLNGTGTGPNPPVGAGAIIMGFRILAPMTATGWMIDYGTTSPNNRQISLFGVNSWGGFEQGSPFADPGSPIDGNGPLPTTLSPVAASFRTFVRSQTLPGDAAFLSLAHPTLPGTFDDGDWHIFVLNNTDRTTTSPINTLNTEAWLDGIGPYPGAPTFQGASAVEGQWAENFTTTAQELAINARTIGGNINTTGFNQQWEIDSFVYVAGRTLTDEEIVEISGAYLREVVP